MAFTLLLMRLKNLTLVVAELESFADGTGVPQLGECFNEYKEHAASMLDRDLPKLVLPENEIVRRRKYPFVSLKRIHDLLEKYQGTGLGEIFMRGGGTNRDDASSGSGTNVLLLEKKEVFQLLRILRVQLESSLSHHHNPNVSGIGGGEGK